MLDRAYLYVAMFVGLFVAGVALAGSEGDKAVAPSAAEARPVPAGTPLPAAPVTGADGVETDLRKVLDGQAGVIIFYRGHWCPFCMKHLQALNGIADTLAESKVKLVAVSTDKPDVVAATVEKTKFKIEQYSDSDLDAAKALGIAFQLDPDTAAKYRDTLVENTGHDKGQLPVPAVFVVDETGTIRFVFSNPDYKVRLGNEELLAEVKKLKGE